MAKRSPTSLLLRLLPIPLIGLATCGAAGNGGCGGITIGGGDTASDVGGGPAAGGSGGFSTGGGPAQGGSGGHSVGGGPAQGGSGGFSTGGGPAVGGSSSAVGGAPANGGSGGASGCEMDAQQMLAAFGACMDYSDWLADHLDQLPLTQTASAGNCASCHNSAVGAVMLSADSLETFETMRTLPYLLKLAMPVYDAAGCAVDILPTDDLVEAGMQMCDPNGLCHPNYQLTPQVLTGLDAFFNATHDKWELGACN